MADIKTLKKNLMCCINAVNICKRWENRVDENFENWKSLHSIIKNDLKLNDENDTTIIRIHHMSVLNYYFDNNYSFFFLRRYAAL